MLRSITLASVIVLLAACGGGDQPTAEQQAFMSAIAPYCGPVIDERSNDQTCNAYLVSSENDYVALLSGFDRDGYAAIVTYRSTHNIVQGGVNHLYAYDYDAENWRFVGPGDPAYAATTQQFLTQRID